MLLHLLLKSKPIKQFFVECLLIYPYKLKIVVFTCFNRNYYQIVAAYTPSLQMVGELKNLNLTTEAQYSLKVEIKN